MNNTIIKIYFILFEFIVKQKHDYGRWMHVT